MPVRVDWWPVQALATDGNGRQEIMTPEGYARHLCENGPEMKYYDATLVADILRGPTSIFQGLNRAEYEESYCYAGKPAARWNGHFDVPPPEGMVFVAYVSYREELDALAVFDWEWIPEDPKRPGQPIDQEQRYTRITWPTI